MVGHKWGEAGVFYFPEGSQISAMAGILPNIYTVWDVGYQWPILLVPILKRLSSSLSPHKSKWCLGQTPRFS